jgi:hypothetical protein
MRSLRMIGCITGERKWANKILKKPGLHLESDNLGLHLPETLGFRTDVHPSINFGKLLQVIIFSPGSISYLRIHL